MPTVAVDISAVGQTVWAKWEHSSRNYKQAAVLAVNGNTQQGTKGVSPDDTFTLQFAGYADAAHNIPRDRIQAIRANPGKYVPPRGGRGGGRGRGGGGVRGRRHKSNGRGGTD